ncbi:MULTISPECIES: hypothetical protein [unclassified Caballeronia]|uniref:hypothetical protein n=1 Tax=unclassified Caballeronia TaxID=2646786 RepID=UPI00286072EE|nr:MULTISPECIES: hypothetical protein [unclassified Caballeronia]MDR5812549.1 hypothetical protein [Caballeronia sp. LZ033]MDR5819401.1 hypothetical protein [Caballeronia sp. LZ043]MDR5877169.1 hypothetical protein [Caballeronia sp. LZ032]
MSDLTCPHCLYGVPRGARVCRGCQAEVYYGLPKQQSLAILFAAGVTVFLGWKISNNAPAAMVVGLIVVIALTVAAKRKYADHVEFKRPYRTRK